MNVAIIGVGRMGRRHIRAVLTLGLELTGIYDASHESLKAATDEFHLGAHVLFIDIEKLFAEAKPELLIIATTADSHCALVCMAAQRNVKYVLVEKPMAVSLSECDKMIEACNRFGTRLSVNHQMRFMDVYKEPKRLASSEAYGGLASMTVVAGNIGFSMNGTHYLEAFRYLTDEAPDSVTAWFSPGVVANPRGTQYEDRAGSMRVTTPSGKRFYLEIGSDQGHGIQVIYACRNGTIALNELSGEMECNERKPEFRGLPTGRYGMPSSSRKLCIEPSEVVASSAAAIRALLEDNDRVSGEDGRRVIETLVAAFLSAESGNIPVRLGSELDRNRIFPWA